MKTKPNKTDCGMATNILDANSIKSVEKRLIYNADFTANL
jgi:hypothetical protein